MRAVFLLLLLPLVHQPPGGPPPGSAPDPPWVIKAQSVKLPDRCWRPALSPDGKRLACASPGGAFVVSFPDGKLIHQLQDNRLEKVRAIAFTPDGKKIIGVQPGIRIWDAATGDLKATIEWEWLPERTLSKNPLALPVLNKDCTRLYVGGPDENVSVLDVETGKEIARTKTAGRAWSLALSPDGKRLAIATRTELRVCGAEKLDDLGGMKFKSPLSSGVWDGVIFPADGRVLIVGPDENRGPPTQSITVWDVAKGEVIATYPNQIPGLNHITPLPGGRYGVGGGPLAPEGLCVFDLKECKPVYAVGVHHGHMHPPLLTPDRKYLVGGSESNSINIVKVEDVLKVGETLKAIPPEKAEKKQ